MKLNPVSLNRNFRLGPLAYPHRTLLLPSPQRNLSLHSDRDFQRNVLPSDGSRLLLRNRLFRHCSHPPPLAPDFKTAPELLPLRHRRLTFVRGFARHWGAMDSRTKSRRGACRPTVGYRLDCTSTGRTLQPQESTTGALRGFGRAYRRSQESCRAILWARLCVERCGSVVVRCRCCNWQGHTGARRYP
jgi:hypothetical protein